MNSATFWIEQLQMEKHPEGGYFKETYRSDEHIVHHALAERFPGDRCLSTSIYFLLGKGDFSAFHRIKSDEVWYFHEGAPLDIFVLDPREGLQVLGLGKEPAAGYYPQRMVKQGCWFASRSTGNYTLAGCSVAPGFDFTDFELAHYASLAGQFPDHKDLIRSLTNQ